jgi:hypothetical protein
MPFTQPLSSARFGLEKLACVDRAPDDVTRMIFEGPLALRLRVVQRAVAPDRDRKIARQHHRGPRADRLDFGAGKRGPARLRQA